MPQIKKRRDFTEGPILSSMILFVIPLILTSMLQIAYNMADNIVVGQFSGDPDALGAVGSTGALTNLIVNFLIGISAGAGVVVAQFYGAKKYDDVSKTVHTSMVFALIGGIVVMVVGLLVVEPALVLMDTKADFLDKSLLYMRIICCGIPASSVYNFGAATLRSVGDSKTPLYILTASGIINVVFNLIFVIAFHMSVDGVALATVISQYLSAIAVVAVLIRRGGECYGINLKGLRISRPHFLRILRFGVPLGIQSSLFAVSNVIIASAANVFDKSVISARTIASNIDNLIYTSMNGFLHAAMTFCGQNYGAKKYRRLNKIFVCALLSVTVIGISTCTVGRIFGDELALVYIEANDPNKEAVIAAVREIMAVMLSTYFLCGIMETVMGVLRGLGYSMLSLTASLIGLGIRVIWVLFVFPREGFTTVFGLYVSYPISWTITITLMLVFCVYAWHKLGIWRGAKEEKNSNNTFKESVQ